MESRQAAHRHYLTSRQPSKPLASNSSARQTTAPAFGCDHPDHRPPVQLVRDEPAFATTTGARACWSNFRERKKRDSKANVCIPAFSAVQRRDDRTRRRTPPENANNPVHRSRSERANP